MTRVPRRLAGIGAADLANSAAFDAYVGPSREVTVDHIRGIIRLHDGSTAGGIDLFGDTVSVVSSRTALAALDTTKTKTVFLKEAGREGVFQWKTGDYSAQIAADTQQGIYVKATAIAATAGAWVRAGGWAVGGADVRFFGVVGDSNGTTGNGNNDTAAFQAALGMGIPIVIPTGVTVRTTAPIVVNGECSIFGNGCNPYKDLVETAANVRGAGSWVYLDHTGIGFTIDGTSGVYDSTTVRLYGWGTFRNQPTPGAGAFTPTANDWDFSVSDIDLDMDDFVCLNPTKFLTGNFSRGGRPRFNKVRGQPLSKGILIDQCYDQAWIDARFWCYWSLNSQVQAYTQANLTSLNTGRVDTLVIKDFFSIYSNIVWLVSDLGNGNLNLAHVDLLYADNSNRSIVFGGAPDGATIEISSMISFGMVAGGSNSIGIAFGAATNSKVDIGFGSFDNYDQQAIYASGTGNRLLLRAARFKNWGSAGTGVAAINVDSGNKVLLGSPPVLIPFSTQPLVTGAGTLEGADTEVAFTSTITALTGSLTTIGANDFTYRKYGDICTIEFSIAITDIGTGAGQLRCTIPFAATHDACGTYLNMNTGVMGSVQLTAGNSVIGLTNYTAQFPIANGQRVQGSITYRCAR